MGCSPVLWFRPSGLRCPLCLCFSNWLTGCSPTLRRWLPIIHLIGSNKSRPQLLLSVDANGEKSDLWRQTAAVWLERFHVPVGPFVKIHKLTAVCANRKQFTCAIFSLDSRANALSKNTIDVTVVLWIAHVGVLLALPAINQQVTDLSQSVIDMEPGNPQPKGQIVLYTWYVMLMMWLFPADLLLRMLGCYFNCGSKSHPLCHHTCLKWWCSFINVVVFVLLILNIPPTLLNRQRSYSKTSINCTLDAHVWQPYKSVTTPCPRY